MQLRDYTDSYSKTVQCGGEKISSLPELNWNSESKPSEFRLARVFVPKCFATRGAKEIAKLLEMLP